MTRILIFTAIAVLTFSSFVVIYAPAALIWRFAEQEVIEQVPDLHILGVSGTVWSGDAELVYRQFPTSQLEWQISPLPILSGEIDTNLHLFGEGHDFVGSGSISQTAAVVQSLVGYVDASYINRVSQPQGLTFAGRVDVNSLSLSSDLVWIQQASGEIYWPGGKNISRTVSAGTQVFDLPALQGDITMRGEAISLNLHHDNETVVEILLRRDGWVTVAVKARLFEIANLPWPAGSSPSDTVLEFEEQVLRSNR
jgi:hypothetical protein